MDTITEYAPQWFDLECAIHTEMDHQLYTDADEEMIWWTDAASESFEAAVW